MLTAIFAKNLRLFWIETQLNPLLHANNIIYVFKTVHNIDAWISMNNTFLFSFMQKPLHLSADFVMHFTTIFIDGHSDATNGVVVAKDQALSNDCI